MNDDEKTIDQRNNRGQFTKGNRANPAGNNQTTVFRKITVPSGADVETMFRANAAIVYEQLVRLIMDPKTPAGAKASAIKTFFERGYGKAAITVSAPSVDSYDGIEISRLSTEVLAEIVRVGDATKGGI